MNSYILLLLYCIEKKIEQTGISVRRGTDLNYIKDLSKKVPYVTGLKLLSLGLCGHALSYLRFLYQPSFPFGSIKKYPSTMWATGKS